MAEQGSTLRGRQILIVEDEYMIAADLARSLKDLGVSVLGPARSVADALAIIQKEEVVDAAVLDVDLGVEKVFAVADALRQRGVPFVFATGYDHWLMPCTYEDVPRFEKPVDTGALARTLSSWP
jgi:CheY-like chemotaxis protein